MSKPPVRCCKCTTELGPMTLDKNHLWCSVCAEPRDPVTGAVPTDIASGISPASADKPLIPPPDVPPSLELRRPALAPTATGQKEFQLTIGNLKLTLYGRVEFRVGATKVVIT